MPDDNIKLELEVSPRTKRFLNEWGDLIEAGASDVVAEVPIPFASTAFNLARKTGKHYIKLTSAVSVSAEKVEISFSPNTAKAKVDESD